MTIAELRARWGAPPDSIFAPVVREKANPRAERYNQLPCACGPLPRRPGRRRARFRWRLREMLMIEN